VPFNLGAGTNGSPLLPGTLYYYRAVGSNSVGVSYGLPLSFQTSNNGGN